MQLKIKKLIICLSIFVPLFCFAQYTYKELPFNKNVPPAKDGFTLDYKAKWISVGKLNSASTKMLQDQLKEKALEIYEIVVLEKKKAKKNDKKIAKETRRYKLYKAMVESLDSIIEKKKKMEKLCYHYHEKTKRAQDIIYKEVIQDSKKIIPLYAEIRSLEK